MTFATPGSQTVEAVVTAPGDPLAPNNRLAREAAVRVAAARAVCRERHGERQVPAGRARSVRVRRGDARAPAAFRRRPPTSSRTTSSFSATCARTAIPEPSMKALAEWVEQDGGGLLVAGGEAVFGEGSPGSRAGLSQQRARTAHAGDVRAQGRARSRAHHRPRQVVEHGRLGHGALQGGGAGGDRRRWPTSTRSASSPSTTG